MAERRRHKKRIQVGGRGGLGRAGTRRERGRHPKRPGARRLLPQGRGAVTGPCPGGASDRSAEGSVEQRGKEGRKEARRSNPASGPAFLRRRARACAGNQSPPERGRRAPAFPPSSVPLALRILRPP